MVPGSDVGMGIVYRRLTPRWATEVEPDLLQWRLRNATGPGKHFVQTSDASEVTNTMSRRAAYRVLNPLCNNMLLVRSIKAIDVRHLEDMRGVSVPRDSEHRAADSFGRRDRCRRDSLQDGDEWLDHEVGCVIPTRR